MYSHGCRYADYAHMKREIARKSPAKATSSGLEKQQATAVPYYSSSCSVLYREVVQNMHF
jgi:hypothetical protein